MVRVTEADSAQLKTAVNAYSGIQDHQISHNPLEMLYQTAPTIIIAEIRLVDILKTAGLGATLKILIGLLGGTVK
jgi:hypothetical protein